MPDYVERALWIGFAIACVVLAAFIAWPWLSTLPMFLPSYLP